jgi:hypothetical protein
MAMLTAALAATVAGLGVDFAGAQDDAGDGQYASYEASAVADGVRVGVAAPGFAVVEQFIDGGGPVAQSLIDGLGNSRAFASLPYPGDLAIAGPALLAGLTGLPAPPSYPFYVDSSYPTKEEATLRQPGYELTAKSQEQASESQAVTGGSSGETGVFATRARATTQRDSVTGVVVAEATGSADLIAIGGALRIGHVSARAKVTRAPAGEPGRESDFTIQGMTIADQPVGISEKGLTIGGQTAPLPPGDPLIQVLEQNKIRVRYLSAVDNPDGVMSPGLVIDQEQQIPGGPTMVFRYVFGRMFARATTSGSPTSVVGELPIEIGPSDSLADTSPLPAEAASSSSSPLGEASPVLRSGSGSETYLPPETPTPTVSSPDGADAGEAAAPNRAPRVAGPASQLISETSAKSVYLILAIGALAAVGGGLLIRLWGVKSGWTS